MRVYGEPFRVREVLLDMCFFPEEIGETGCDENGSFVRVKRPDEIAIANLKAKPGIENVRVDQEEPREVFCGHFEN